MVGGSGALLELWDAQLDSVIGFLSDWSPAWSHMNFLQVLQFPPLSQKHVGQRTDYAQSPQLWISVLHHDPDPG